MFSDIVDEVYNYVLKSQNKEFDKKILKKDSFLAGDIFSLIHSNSLEIMAKRVLKNNKKFFGNVVYLYAPLYISNYCRNICTYCGFKSTNNIKRKKLNINQILKEANFLYKMGIEHVLVLTGEDHINSSFDYIYNTVKNLKKLFKEVSIETYSLNEQQYKKLVEIGLIGVTMYQETYSKGVYGKVHIFGLKSNYKKRLDTIEYAIKAGVREISIGALLGLNDPYIEVPMMIYHMDYLLKKYPNVEYSISFPRIKNALNVQNDFYNINDIDFIKFILSAKLIFPRVHINISTRESFEMRNALIGVATKMSAGSSTSVGGYTINNDSEQFSIEDSRSVKEFRTYIESRNFKPTTVNWF
ncbi:thiamine biosynthesis protein ThiH [Tepiditoga spiralis]|uniref:Thiamine biosynthesis protein ThiH n=1 Tax=Tepiditoga spiralis TaxID=2108365 RepID=A0A7G1G4H5_9BACT|nr:radical SAM protein [Tepiditoga spiralis]BBE31418.1 thiamine biosynthesis protein ThiH [Tepiditoga spiralis]